MLMTILFLPRDIQIENHVKSLELIRYDLNDVDNLNYFQEYTDKTIVIPDIFLYQKLSGRSNAECYESWVLFVKFILSIIRGNTKVIALKLVSTENLFIGPDSELSLIHGKSALTYNIQTLSLSLYLANKPTFSQLISTLTAVSDINFYIDTPSFWASDEGAKFLHDYTKSDTSSCTNFLEISLLESDLNTSYKCHFETLSSLLDVKSDLDVSNSLHDKSKEKISNLELDIEKKVDELNKANGELKKQQRQYHEKCTELENVRGMLFSADTKISQLKLRFDLLTDKNMGIARDVNENSKILASSVLKQNELEGSLARSISEFHQYRSESEEQKLSSESEILSMKTENSKLRLNCSELVEDCRNHRETSQKKKLLIKQKISKLIDDFKNIKHDVSDLED